MRAGASGRGVGVMTQTLPERLFEGVDFVDFGSGVGRSLLDAEKRFGARGVGVEVRPAKVETARANGANVHLGSILDVPRDIDVDFVTIDNVLEHLPDEQTVEDVLAVAADIARDFIYIRHPCFEDEAYLNALGLKQYWTDWRGHPSHLLLSDLVAILRRLGLGLVEFEFVGAATTSADPTILPVDAPVDSFEYDESEHGPKPTVDLDRPAHYAIDLFVPARAAGNRVALDYVDDPRRSRRHPRLEVGPAVTTGRAPRTSDLQARVEELESRRALRVANAVGGLRRASGFGGRARAAGRVWRAARGRDAE